MSRALLLLVILGKAAAITAWLLGLIAFWSALACFFGFGLIMLYHLLVPGAQGLGRVYTRFVTDQPEIWLTIDDGPDETDTPRILDLLEKNGARATFFLVGERAARLPHLVEEILKRGHAIGHHSHTHPAGTFWCASPGRLQRELDDALNFFAAHRLRPQWFRAPAGIKNLFLDRALRERALACVGWSVRSWDTVRRDPRRVVDGVMRRIRPGAIVLMHEGRRIHPSVRGHAIAGLLSALRARGFACVLPDASQLR